MKVLEYAFCVVVTVCLLVLLKYGFERNIATGVFYIIMNAPICIWMWKDTVSKHRKQRK